MLPRMNGLSKEKEKRCCKSKRIRMKTSVPVRVGDQKPAATQGVTRDISSQGVYIFMETKVTNGSLMELVLPLPAVSEDQPPNWVHCKCRVLRVEDISGASPEYGVAAAIEEYQTVSEATVPE